MASYNSYGGRGDDAEGELNQIQTKTHQVVDESLESTRRMMALCEESQDTGARTLDMLNVQGEQLDRIEEGMDQINTDMKEAEKNLKSLAKCCGLCAFPCSKGPEFKEDSQTWKENSDGKIVNNQPTRFNDDRNGIGANGGGGEGVAGGFIARITNDAREDEMEDNMGQVSTMIGNLRNMAVDMGTEIQSQNNQVDRITNKAVSNATRIEMANQKAGKLLKS